jgi:hypothetical protein
LSEDPNADFENWISNLILVLLFAEKVEARSLGIPQKSQECLSTFHFPHVPVRKNDVELQHKLNVIFIPKPVRLHVSEPGEQTGVGFVVDAVCASRTSQLVRAMVLYTEKEELMSDKEL